MGSLSARSGSSGTTSRGRRSVLAWVVQAMRKSQVDEAESPYNEREARVTDAQQRSQTEPRIQAYSDGSPEDSERSLRALGYVGSRDSRGVVAETAAPAEVR